MKVPAVLNVEQLFAAAFAIPRDPRSPEYMEGVRAALAFRIERRKFECRYEPGTAQADAFQAGTGEGHRLWRAADEQLRNMQRLAVEVPAP